MPLTVVGLGPGSAELLTAEARQRLTAAHGLVVASQYFSAFRHLLPNIPVDLLPDSGESAMLTRLLDLAQSAGDVVFAVPGNPVLDGTLTHRLISACSGRDIHLGVVPGISLADWAMQRLRLDPTVGPGLAAGNGIQIADGRGEGLDPSRAALVLITAGRADLDALQARLLTLYPADTHIVLLNPFTASDGNHQQPITLAELAAASPLQWGCLYLPRLALTENLATFEGLAQIVAKLRAPDGCPWDREQTHESLKRYLLEEAYEALDALDKGDLAGLQEELGDILLNILLQCQIASEAGEFETRDVLRHIAEKLIRRHPHVFGDLRLSSAAEVMSNWEALKSKERAENRSMLDGLPVSLPALAYTRSLQERLGSLQLEALGAQGGSPPPENIDGLGQALFDLAYRAALLGLDPAEALLHANSRFRAKIAALENKVRSRGTTLSEVGRAQTLELWQSIQQDA